jgi:hypothetical protein
MYRKSFLDSVIRRDQEKLMLADGNPHLMVLLSLDVSAV